MDEVAEAALPLQGARESARPALNNYPCPSPRRRSVPPTRQALSQRAGLIVVTRFTCPNVSTLLRLVPRHVWVKHHVLRRVTGVLQSYAVIEWRARRLMSVSLWVDVESIYAMGTVPQHIHAARIPHRLGVTTDCSIYSLSGDWRQVMFGLPSPGATIDTPPTHQI
jgi:hypothetical protein